MNKENKILPDKDSPVDEIGHLQLRVSLRPELLNKIHLGDSFEFLEGCPPNVFDLILEDMPYNTTACDWDVKVDLERYWETRLRVLKPTGVVVLTASQPFSSQLVTSNLKMFRYQWIWDKINGANFMNLDNRPFKTHEQILVFSSTANFIFNAVKIKRTQLSLKRHPVGKILKIKSKRLADENHLGITEVNVSIDGTGLKHPIDILQYSYFNENRYSEFKHPTRKPVGLFEYLIRTYTNESDLVFDGFGGSGTTAIAAYRSKRNFIVVEKEPKYFELSQKRLAEEVKQCRLF